MVDVAIMIEAQQGVGWERWRRLGRTVEDCGFAGLYRSDHFTDPSGPKQDTVELWSSLTWLADNTSRIEFGPLVSPVSFRHPVITAWTARSVHDLSGGRLRLGVGAGWQEREHNAYGFDLLDTDRRFARFEEALLLLSLLLRDGKPASLQGEFYNLDEAALTPDPGSSGPPLVIGGNGPTRTLPLVARYADEWNAVALPPARFSELNDRLDELAHAEGRQPEQIKRTLMTRVVFGRTSAEVRRKLDGASPDELRAAGAIVGTAEEVAEQISDLGEAGASRVMLQWLEVDDTDGLRDMAASVLPCLDSAD